MQNLTIIIASSNPPQTINDNNEIAASQRSASHTITWSESVASTRSTSLLTLPTVLLQHIMCHLSVRDLVFRWNQLCHTARNRLFTEVLHPYHLDTMNDGRLLSKMNQYQLYQSWLYDLLKKITKLTTTLLQFQHFVDHGPQRSLCKVANLEIKVCIGDYNHDDEVKMCNWPQLTQLRTLTSSMTRFTHSILKHLNGSRHKLKSIRLANIIQLLPLHQRSQNTEQMFWKSIMQQIMQMGDSLIEFGLFDPDYDATSRLIPWPTEQVTPTMLEAMHALKILHFRDSNACSKQWILWHLEQQTKQKRHEFDIEHLFLDHAWPASTLRIVCQYMNLSSLHIDFQSLQMNGAHEDDTYRVSEIIQSLFDQSPDLEFLRVIVLEQIEADMIFKGVYNYLTSHPVGIHSPLTIEIKQTDISWTNMAGYPLLNPTMFGPGNYSDAYLNRYFYLLPLLRLRMMPHIRIILEGGIDAMNPHDIATHLNLYHVRNCSINIWKLFDSRCKLTISRGMSTAFHYRVHYADYVQDDEDESDPNTICTLDATASVTHASKATETKDDEQDDITSIRTLDATASLTHASKATAKETDFADFDECV